MLSATEIKALRESKNLTQDEVAAALDVKRESISQIESGKTKPDGKPARRYIEYLRNYGKESPVPTFTHNKDSKPIPYYNIDVTAGAVDLFSDNKEIPDYKIDIPGFNDCDFAVPVSGHSMYPKISSGNIIFCKLVEHLQFIEFGQIYLIVADGRRMLKQIRKGETKDRVALVSENPEYDTFEIPLQAIKKLYLVKGWANKNEI